MNGNVLKELGGTFVGLGISIRWCGGANLGAQYASLDRETVNQIWEACRRCRTLGHHKFPGWSYCTQKFLLLHYFNYLDK
jgi:hypothetical protein